MDVWYDFVRGPLLRLALLILLLGLARRAVLLAWGTVEALRNARDRRIPVRSILGRTLSWLVPVSAWRRSRPLSGITSFVFHLGLVVGALFLREHIDIWQLNVGFGWLALPRPVVDALTIVAILTGLGLLLYRMYAPNVRAFSGGMDYLLLMMLVSICVTGFIAARPWNPVPYAVTMFVHALLGIGMLILIPFTKLSHCLLFPLVRFASEIGWHMIPNAGSRVVRTLYGPAERKI